MDELTYKCDGRVVFPVQNHSENFIQDCDIRFMVSVKAGIADEAAYQKALEEREPGQYLKEHMPRFMKEAMAATWGNAMPARELNVSLTPMQEPIRKRIETELEGFGLQFRAFLILSLSVKSEDLEALRAHETPPSPERMEEIRKNMLVDEPYRPEKLPVEPLFRMSEVPAAPAPRKVESWDCIDCGRKNITSRFCPECGAPCRAPESWTCAHCGTKDLTGKFCPECGMPRP